MSLQDTFYLMAIIYMGIMFVAMIAVVIAIFVIKAKVSAIHDQIERKINAVINIAHAGEEIYDTAKKVFTKKR